MAALLQKAERKAWLLAWPVEHWMMQRLPQSPPATARGDSRADRHEGDDHF
jgi:hypothetical protein